MCQTKVLNLWRCAPTLRTQMAKVSNYCILVPAAPVAVVKLGEPPTSSNFAVGHKVKAACADLAPEANAENSIKFLRNWGDAEVQEIVDSYEAMIRCKAQLDARL